MAIAQLAEFSQILMGRIVLVLILSAIGVLIVSVLLEWLKRAVIRGVRSARANRETEKSTSNADESAVTPHCPVCNAVMVKTVARRGPGAGSTFWGCSNYPKCRGTRAI
jgi:hypothetical protein